MSNDQRSLIAIVICVFFYLGYDQYLKSKYPEYGKRLETPTETAPTAPSGGATTTTSPAGTTAAASDATAPAVPRLADDQLSIGSDAVTYRFSQDVGGIASVMLRDYRTGKAADAPFVELLDKPIALQGIVDSKVRQPVLGVFTAQRQDRTITFSRDQGGIRISEAFTVPDKGYGATLKTTFTNISSQAIDLTAGLLMHETAKSKKSSSMMGFIPGVVTERVQLIYRADGSTTWEDVETLCTDDELIGGTGVPVSYLGIDRHYFLGVVEPKDKTVSYAVTHGTEQPEGCPISMAVYDAQGIVTPGQSVSIDYSLYFGPKEPALLAEHGPELSSAMHLGFFDFIAKPLLLLIEGIKQLTGNYGVAIVLLTFLLKVLFYPLVRASSMSAYKMRKLTPEINAMKEKFKDDKQRQQQEMMKLWVTHKVNPMKGCLPILPQIPVFFAFYQVLQTSIQLRHAPFFGWIQDLSAMDPYFVTPLLMGVAMFVQQKLTPTTGMDKTQEKILMFMPIMFTAMMLTLPAGLTLYMLTNTVTGIAQQKWLYYKLDKSGA